MLNYSPDFIYKLSDHLQENNQLESLIQQFITDYDLVPCFGVEIEFFLSKDIDLKQFEAMLGLIIKKEKGDNQFEVDLPPTTNLTKYANQITDLKANIVTIAKQLGGEANFQSKPFINDYGNSMHFHINFLSSSKCEHQDQDQILSIAAKSLCHFMLDTFVIFMPQEEDYLRLDSAFMAPTHVSYGNNNRTVAIRMPDLLPKRLEHRLPSPSADPYLVMFTILKSILLGLQFPEQVNELPKIYGNAFDRQYKLIAFPRSMKEATTLLKIKLLFD